MTGQRFLKFGTDRCSFANMQNAEPEEVYDAIMGGEMLLAEFKAWLALRRPESLKSDRMIPRKAKDGDRPFVSQTRRL